MKNPRSFKLKNPDSVKLMDTLKEQGKIVQIEGRTYMLIPTWFCKDETGVYVIAPEYLPQELKEYLQNERS